MVPFTGQLPHVHFLSDDNQACGQRFSDLWDRWEESCLETAGTGRLKESSCTET